jgi:hypothetical protein
MRKGGRLNQSLNLKKSISAEPAGFTKTKTAIFCFARTMVIKKTGI